MRRLSRRWVYSQWAPVHPVLYTAIFVAMIVALVALVIAQIGLIIEVNGWGSRR